MSGHLGSLLDEIRRFRPADDLEEKHRSEFLELLSSVQDPFSRTHFSPGHLTASCFIVDPGARVLLHHHRRLGRWLQMGGHIDGGETSSAAALRESLEESGLTDLQFVVDGLFDLDVHRIPAGKGEPEHRHFDLRYLAMTRSPERIVTNRAESRELAWFSLDQAMARMNDEAGRRPLEKIARMFGSLTGRKPARLAPGIRSSQNNKPS